MCTAGYYLRVVPGKEVLVIVECADVVIRIRMEQVTEDIGVSCRLLSPQVPDFIGQRICHKSIPLISLVPVVRTNIRRLGVGVFARIQGLSWQQAQVFAPEHATKSCCVVSSLVFTTVHDRRKCIGVLHDDGKFRIVVA